GPPSPTTTTITADSASMVANGSSSSTITVEIRDASGNLVGASAGPVTLATTLGSLGAVTDHDDGTYTATLTTGTVTGTAVVTGTLNAAAIQDSAVVQFAAGPPDTNNTTTITANPTTIGTSLSNTASAGDLQIAAVRVLPDTSTITVTVRDANGNLLGASAGTVTLSTTLGSLSAVVDHNDGTYTATLTAGTTAGTATVTGSLNGVAIADTATVTIQAQ
ncbi:MAG: Ig-like domain-containing protein, partial [Gemmatimonadota bacterium]